MLKANLSGNRKIDGIDRKSSEIPGLGGARTCTESKTERVISKFGFAEVTSLNNILYEMIFKRKSFHIFRNVGNESISKDELNDIQSAYSEFTPLNPGIKTAIRIVPEKQTNCKRGGEYCVLLYSEKKDGYLQNIGYEQVAVGGHVSFLPTRGINL